MLRNFVLHSIGHGSTYPCWDQIFPVLIKGVWNDLFHLAKHHRCWGWGWRCWYIRRMTTTQIYCSFISMYLKKKYENKHTMISNRLPSTTRGTQQGFVALALPGLSQMVLFWPLLYSFVVIAANSVLKSTRIFHNDISHLCSEISWQYGVGYNYYD